MNFVRLERPGRILFGTSLLRYAIIFLFLLSIILTFSMAWIKRPRGKTSYLVGFGVLTAMVYTTLFVISAFLFVLSVNQFVVAEFESSNHRYLISRDIPSVLFSPSKRLMQVREEGVFWDACVAVASEDERQQLFWEFDRPPKKDWVFKRTLEGGSDVGLYEREGLIVGAWNNCASFVYDEKKGQVVIPNASAERIEEIEEEKRQIIVYHKEKGSDPSEDLGKMVRSQPLSRTFLIQPGATIYQENHKGKCKQASFSDL